MIPDLSDVKIKDGDVVAVDLETYDPDLKKHGSGAILSMSDPDKGFVVGIALAYGDKKFYIPLNHKENKAGGHPPKYVWRILNKKIFQNEKVTKVFHNAMYDVCWIRAATEMMVKGPILDTMIAASIIDENRMRYSLDSLAKDYLNDSKYKYDLAEKALNDHGISDPMSNMHKLPYSLVKDYAEQDVNLTLRLWNKFEKIIKTPIKTESKSKKTLENIFNLETRLFPCLVDMRFKGVRIDEKKAKTLGKDLEKRKEHIIRGIKKRTGISVEIWAASSVQQLLDQQDIKDYKKTPKSGRASLSKNYLESHPNIYLRLIARARQYDKIINVFVDGILKFVHKGRIHAEINQIRSERGGTVTGRFSMRNPNLQQIPAKGKYGNIIRSLFLPEEGQEWGSFDYSQQEPRLVVHYALKNGMRGVVDLAEQYQKNPKTDFHALVAGLAKITRKQAKTINLGLFYGMGKNKLAHTLELDDEESKELFDQYHRKVPFIRELSNGLQKFAERNKNIFTLEDRFCRFDKWEPIDKEWDNERRIFVYSEQEEIDGKKQIVKVPVPVMDLKRAKDHYLANRSRNLADNDPNCKYFEKHYRPAFTYKALNRLIQGSAADMTKKAMVELHKKGIVPHIQIHDELCISVDSEEKATMIKKTMKKAAILLIPNKVNCKKGANWGTIK
jgi:DNA polymerase I-like protein with 3'-5' exonuclease and polymerase domains